MSRKAHKTSISTSKPIRFENEMIDEITNSDEGSNFSAWVKLACREKLDRDSSGGTGTAKRPKKKVNRIETEITYLKVTNIGQSAVNIGDYKFEIGVNILPLSKLESLAVTREIKHQDLIITASDKCPACNN